MTCKEDWERYLPASQLSEGGQNNKIEGDDAADRVAWEAKAEHPSGAGTRLIGQLYCCKCEGLSRLHFDLCEHAREVANAAHKYGETEIGM